MSKDVSSDIVIVLICADMSCLPIHTFTLLTLSIYSIPNDMLTADGIISIYIVVNLVG